MSKRLHMSKTQLLACSLTAEERKKRQDESKIVVTR